MDDLLVLLITQGKVTPIMKKYKIRLKKFYFILLRLMVQRADIAEEPTPKDLSS